MVVSSYDSKVGRLAYLFIEDLMGELKIRLTDIQREEFTRQVARAMQQAIEDELEAIREELG